MRSKEISLTHGVSMRRLANLFILSAFLSLLSIPLALATEAQTSVTTKNQTQPSVPASTNPGSGKTAPKIPGTPSTVDSTDFLMEEPPLVESTAVDETSPAPEPPAPVTLEVLQGIVLKEVDEVAMLVSEQCSQKGSAAEGTNACTRVYSNGHRTTVLTENAMEGNVTKQHTVTKEFAGDNILLYRKTIRHRVDYDDRQGQKTMGKELFDIIHQPTGSKVTRELMAYEYFPDTGKIRSLSWTQYRQIADEPKAGLAYHALLRYGDDGSPDRGLAERWDGGKKAEIFMNWSRLSKGFATLDEESWNQWESWIRTVALQAYLP